MVFNENKAKYRMFAARWRTVYGAIALIKHYDYGMLVPENYYAHSKAIQMGLLLCRSVPMVKHYSVDHVTIQFVYGI